MGVSGNGALGRGHEGVGCQPGLGGEATGAGGLGLEAVDGVTVLLAIIVGEGRGEIAGSVRAQAMP